MRQTLTAPLVRIAMAAIAVAGLALATISRPAAQNAPVNPCQVRTSERIVAVGDVHGGYDALVAILRVVGVIDRRDRWAGGRTVFVQTGDVVDRGPDSRRVLDLLRTLEREASRAGGAVYALLGNHEVMRMLSDWRYVSPEEYEAFTTAGSPQVREALYTLALADDVKAATAAQRSHDEAVFRERFLRQFPLGFVEMHQAFAADGDYGRWLRARPSALRINDIFFVHGGLTLASAALGCDGINAAVARELTNVAETVEQAAQSVSSSESGPLWYRGLAEEPEDTFASTLTEILATAGARAIVIGHTVTPSLRIRTRFGGRVVQIDTGLLGGSFYRGGVPSALEIRGASMRAIYTDRSEPLAFPATTP
jgi:hypothetical protein